MQTEDVCKAKELRNSRSLRTYTYVVLPSFCFGDDGVSALTMRRAYRTSHKIPHPQGPVFEARLLRNELIRSPHDSTGTRLGATALHEIFQRCPLRD